MPLSQQLLGEGKAADLPACELPAAVAASRGHGRRYGSSSRRERGGSGCGGRVGALAPIPRPLDPPRHGPHADALPMRSSLSPQVGGAIAGGQILPVGESLAAAHHCQVDVLATAEHLSHGAAESVDRLGAERHHRTDRATAGGRRPLVTLREKLCELLAGLEGFRAFWAAPALMAVSPDPLLQLPPDPSAAVVSSNARCRFRTSDILLVRQALYR